jgi:hypothetical protein
VLRELDAFETVGGLGVADKPPCDDDDDGPQRRR